MFLTAGKTFEDSSRSLVTLFDRPYNDIHCSCISIERITDRKSCVFTP